MENCLSPPRSGRERAYTAGDLLVHIAPYEDLEHKQYGCMYSHSNSPRDTVYSSSPTMTRNNTWSNKAHRSKAFDADSLIFPPMFFPRDRDPPGPNRQPIRVGIGFRVFQVASVLIVGLSLYALVDNIVFLGRLKDEPRQTLDIHKQLQLWEEDPRVFSHHTSHPNRTSEHYFSEMCKKLQKGRKNNFANKDKASLSSSATPGGIYFLIVVHSAPTHHSERQTIRSTWASVKRLKKYSINLHLIFVVGKSSSPTIDNSIRRENELYDDVLLGEFVDSYRNLTQKHLLWMEWIKNCPQAQMAKYILKTDDDVFVDIFQLFEFLFRNFGRDPQPGTLICNVVPEGTAPVRAKNSKGAKWAVTMDEYPHSIYPRYCAGLAYLATPDVITKIVDVSHRSKSFWIDDVYVTGILRELAHIQEPFYLNLRYSFNEAQYRKWLLPEVAASTLLPIARKGIKGDYYEDDKKANEKLRKFPFLFAHIERGERFSAEMNDLWRKTLRNYT